MKFFAYVTTRNIGDLYLPVPAQNSALRESAARINAQYMLPRVEHFFKNSYIELNTLLELADPNSIIGMYSYIILPNDLLELDKISKKLIRKKLTIYFVLENKYFKNLSDIKNLYLSHKLRNMQINNSPNYKFLKKFASFNFH